MYRFISTLGLVLILATTIGTTRPTLVEARPSGVGKTVTVKQLDKPTQEIAQIKDTANIKPQSVSQPVSGAKAFIYEHESGNVPCKLNGGAINCAGSDYLACGLGQALPCSKLLAVCPNLADYACQDTYFTSYMHSRYGTWENAVAFWQQNHWW